MARASRLNPLQMRGNAGDAELRRFLVRLGFRLEAEDPAPVVTYVDATETGSVIEMTPTIGGTAIGPGEPGTPVVNSGVIRRVAVSWLSDNAPAGDWTLTLWKRSSKELPVAAATFNFTTS